jgi:hypothetical protein
VLHLHENPTILHQATIGYPNENFELLRDLLLLFDEEAFKINNLN